MVSLNVGACALLELAVFFFQIFGVTALCLSRLMPDSRWAERGRAGVLVALLGLGVAGAFCGQHDSEFALFAGVTMTVLLIGMTMGGGYADASHLTHRPMSPDTQLAV